MVMGSESEELVAVPIIVMICPLPVVVSTVAGNETEKDVCAEEQYPANPKNAMAINFFIIPVTLTRTATQLCYILFKSNRCQFNAFR